MTLTEILTTRLPPDLAAKVENKAKNNRWTVSQTLAYIIDQHFAAYSTRKRFTCPRCQVWIEAEVTTDGEAVCPACENDITI